MVQYTGIHGTITTLLYIGVPDIYIHVHANIHDNAYGQWYHIFFNYQLCDNNTIWI